MYTVTMIIQVMIHMTELSGVVYNVTKISPKTEPVGKKHIVNLESNSLSLLLKFVYQKGWLPVKSVPGILHYIDIGKGAHREKNVRCGHNREKEEGCHT